MPQRAIVAAVIDHLFVYGTLMPTEPAWPVLAPHVREHAPDRVTAVLWDTGFGFPGLVVTAGGVGPAGGRAGGHVHAAPVPGTVARLHREDLEARLGALDDYEGLGPHRYRRARVRTETGIECWTYEWVGDRTGFRHVRDGWAQWVLDGHASSRNP